jgi:hypothetical protein
MEGPTGHCSFSGNVGAVAVARPNVDGTEGSNPSTGCRAYGTVTDPVT